MSPQFSLPSVYFTALNFESDALIWLRRNNQVLKSLVRSLDLLFPRTHKPIPRLDPTSNLRKLKLEEYEQRDRADNETDLQDASQQEAQDSGDGGEGDARHAWAGAAFRLSRQALSGAPGCPAS